MLTCSGPANAGSTNGSLGLCCINLAISRATARWKHLRWRSERPGKRLSDIPASCVSQERIFVISRAAKGSKDSQVSQGWIGTFFFRKQPGGHFLRKPFLCPPSMSDGAGNCTVMIVHPVRCQGRQKTGVSTTFLTHHTALYSLAQARSGAV